MYLIKVKNVIYLTVECSGSALLTLLTDRPGQLEERFSKSTQPQETDQSSSIAKGIIQLKNAVERVTLQKICNKNSPTLANLLK